MRKKYAQSTGDYKQTVWGSIPSNCFSYFFSKKLYYEVGGVGDGMCGAIV